ncbi:hypothetical protein EDB19DRAFT_1698719 [Suillus lakei]|nr:hypothetical protein EDB19DRAFT_1698719 [Suillus lakei]
MITKLIIFCLQTGLATTMAAFVALGIWAVCRFDIKHLYMYFPIGGCENLITSLKYIEYADVLALWQYMLHVFSPSELFSTAIKEATDSSLSFIARESYLQPQTIHDEIEISEISFSRFTQYIHEGLDLPDTTSGHQETLVMQGGAGFSKASQVESL